ncbi:MAG: serine/threonine-protein kinase [Gemmatimonadaceae bacterium]
MSVDQTFIEFQGVLAGRYSLDRELGRGGMGIVYLAREVHLDRLVAIKLLPPQRAVEGDLRERFLREARLAAKLSHPNIIPIHAVDDVEGFVFFVMSYVDGETLANRVRTRGPLSASDGTRVLREVAWALAYAHGQGLVHRDVKPDNILIETGSGRALVADFGIAAAAEDAEHDGISGTPEFMSPEQVMGQPLDARSDLYSLGATAYYAFTGRLVFEGKTSTEVLAKQVAEQPAPIASLGTPMPRRLGAIVDRCLAKDPEHRPANAGVLAEQLAAALEQRREVPATLRNFVKREGRIDGAGALVGSLGTFFGGVAISAFAGPAIGFSVIGGGLLLMPLAYLISEARTLAKSGFAHRDLEPAFRAEIELAREERVAANGVPSKRIEHWLRGATRVFGAVAAVSMAGSLAAMFRFPPAFIFDNFTITATLALGTVLSTTAFIGSAILLTFRLQRSRDVDTEIWSRLWNGRLGRTLFALGQRLAPGDSARGAMTHRATELSLGMAAEQLFSQLPKESRDALGDLPDVLKRLQDDAKLLRARHDELADALSSASDADSSQEYAEIRALRDEAKLKQSQTIAALETIRLGLLRMHAGATTVASLSTHLGAAADVAADVERLLEARAEVDRALRFPRDVAPTPV